MNIFSSVDNTVFFLFLTSMAFSGFLQLSQDQIPEVFKEFSWSPILDKTRLYGVKKVYTIIGYSDKNLIVFDYCKQYMIERQFVMKCTEFLQPRKIQIAGVFKEFPWTYPSFPEIDVNMKNLSIPGFIKA